MSAKDKLRKLRKKISKMETRHMLAISDLQIELDRAKYSSNVYKARLDLVDVAYKSLKATQSQVVLAPGEHIEKPEESIVEVKTSVVNTLSN